MAESIEIGRRETGFFDRADWVLVPVLMLGLELAHLADSRVVLAVAMAVGGLYAAARTVGMFLDIENYSFMLLMGSFSLFSYLGGALPQQIEFIALGELVAYDQPIALIVDLQLACRACQFIVLYYASCVALSHYDRDPWKRMIASFRGRIDCLTDASAGAILVFLLALGAIYGGLLVTGMLGINEVYVETADNRSVVWLQLLLTMFPPYLTLAAVLLYKHRQNRTMQLVVIGLVLVGAAVGLTMGRRTVIFALAVFGGMIVFLYRLKFSAKRIASVTIAGLVGASLVSILFMALRMAKYAATDEGRGSSFFDLLAGDYLTSSLLVDASNEIWRNFVLRANVLDFLSRCMEVMSEANFFHGMLLVSAIAYAIPSALWPGKDQFTAANPGTEASVIQATGIPDTDYPWSLPVNAYCDFGLFGLLLMPALMLAYGRAMIRIGTSWQGIAIPVTVWSLTVFFALNIEADFTTFLVGLRFCLILLVAETVLQMRPGASNA